ncbi:hypothetical protein [uncultured Enterovirga sp.]
MRLGRVADQADALTTLREEIDRETRLRILRWRSVALDGQSCLRR